MKKILFFLLLFPIAAFAQVKTHTVQAKESFTSIGRLYDVNGRVLANYNNLSYEGGLSIGQVIKIPASATATTAPVPVTETKVPVNTSGSPMYHTVGKKETLYHISTLYPGATVDNLKKWNNISGDAVSEGAVLIVGFGNQKQAVVQTQVVTTTTPVETKSKQTESPVVDHGNANTVASPVKSDKPLTSTGGGFFNTSYSGDNNKEVTGEAGIFKSTSGWDDEKYYCLYNDARPGTIIKVTNPATDKFIFAKVLDVIPDLKENSSVVLRLSNSAADVLGASGSSFNCKINY